MTDMRRVTVSIPDEIDKRILAMRSIPGFERCTYSEIARRLFDAGLEVFNRSTAADAEKRENA